MKIHVEYDDFGEYMETQDLNSVDFAEENRADFPKGSEPFRSNPAAKRR